MQQDIFDQLCFYTMNHPDPRFLHQLAVDAHTAQTATESSKTIAVFFALMGLHLVVEKGWTGRQVQLAHVRLAPRKSQLPRPKLPIDRGAMTVADVLQAAPGEARDNAIRAWCESVWEAFCVNEQTTRPVVAGFLKSALGIDRGSADHAPSIPAAAKAV
jgi:hypothetical protein